jgi:hypothetical protein
LFFISGTPIIGIFRQALTCPKSCPKNGDVPKSPFLPIGSHGAYRQAQFQTLLFTKLDDVQLAYPRARL